MKNKKGFTLIELLAVIVILAVLLGIAIPAVAKYINTSKKSTFVSNAQSYAKAARSEAMIGTYNLPVNLNDATVITFSRLQSALENGGVKSSYDGTFNSNYSYVIIVNEGSAEAPQYVYYIAAADSNGYGIGAKNTTTNKFEAKVLAYDSIENNNVGQLGYDTDGTTPKGIKFPSAAATNGVYSFTLKTGVTIKVPEENYYQ